MNVRRCVFPPLSSSESKKNRCKNMYNEVDDQGPSLPSSNRIASPLGSQIQAAAAIGARTGAESRSLKNVESSASTSRR
jgi:hypothetical protein